MPFPSIRENNYYKYGIELPFIAAGVTALITDPTPASSVVPVLLSSISTYAHQNNRGTESSRLFNVASGIVVGISTAYGFNEVASNLQMNANYLPPVFDTIGAFTAYAGIRFVNKFQSPSSPNKKLTIIG